MSKQANKTIIGVFVLGAVALFVAAVLVFGGGKFFKKSYKVVMFFDGSIKGLNVGAPVMFRGVQVGSVTEIKLILDARDTSMTIPVYVELEPDRWVLVGGEQDVSGLKKLVDKGLRAQLQTQSILTGLLMVSLDMMPDKPAKLVGEVKEYPEIPTVSTQLEELAKTIEDLPLKEIVESLNSVLAGLDKLVNSPDMEEDIRSIHITLADTRATLNDVRKLVEHIDNKVDPLMADIHGISVESQESLKQSQKTLKAIESDAAEITASVKETLETADVALKQAEKTLATYSGDSRVIYDLQKTLKDLSDASRSLEDFFDYLERHPEALLSGKPEPEGESK